MVDMRSRLTIYLRPDKVRGWERGGERTGTERCPRGHGWGLAPSCRPQTTIDTSPCRWTDMLSGAPTGAHPLLRPLVVQVLAWAVAASVSQPRLARPVGTRYRLGCSHPAGASKLPVHQSGMASETHGEHADGRARVPVLLALASVQQIEA